MITIFCDFCNKVLKIGDVKYNINISYIGKLDLCGNCLERLRVTIKDLQNPSKNL